MPSHDTSTATSCQLHLAGVRFVLPCVPAAPEAWPVPFRGFLGEAADADLACEVRCPGADEALAREPPDPQNPWQFRAQGGACELTRRAADGVALWRIRAPLGFARATVTWHPQRFPAHYGDAVQAWTTGLGLSLLVFRLRACGGLVLHGAAAALDGRGILCTGVSGAGKSTLARLLHAGGAAVLTDERPVLRQQPPAGGEAGAPPAFRVYGSPWPSSAGLASNACAPLQRIYFLEHGADDRLTPLSPREALARMLHVTTIPWQDPAFFDPCLATLDALLRSVPCAVLAFRPTPAAVDLIRKDLAPDR